jgi:hypothetical protein
MYKKVKKGGIWGRNNKEERRRIRKEVKKKMRMEVRDRSRRRRKGIEEII